MKPINYWLTFHDIADKYREVMAVRVVYELSDDHLHGRAEVPFLGIVIEGDGTVLAQALSLAQGEISRRYNGQIRQGLQTQAWNGETRDVRYTETDGVIFGRERCVEEEVIRKQYWPDLKLYPVLNHVVEQNETAALGNADAVFAVGIDTSAHATLKFSSGHAVADAAITPGHVNLENDTFHLEVDGHHLKPAVFNPHEITDLKAIDGRRVDNVLATHDADALGHFGAGYSPGQSGIPRQLGLFFVDDVSFENAKGTPKDRPDQMGPSREICNRVDNKQLASVVRHPGRRVSFIDQRGFAEEVGLGGAVLNDRHLIGLDVNRLNEDAALVTRRPPAGISRYQPPPRAGSRCQPPDLVLFHQS